MRRSQTRILTTHTGSLPRPDTVSELVARFRANERIDNDAEFRAGVEDAMVDLLASQARAGIDIANDGEVSRMGFTTQVLDRVAGFGGKAVRNTPTDFLRYPGYAKLFASAGEGVGEWAEDFNAAGLPACTTTVAYDDEMVDVRRDVELFGSALERFGPDRFAGTFLTTASPGLIASQFLLDDNNDTYATDRDYVLGLAEAVKPEYEYIASHGHIVQLDAPDLAGERAIIDQDKDMAAFLRRVQDSVDAINVAVADLPREQVRVHVCFGNYGGPHTDDPMLDEVLPVIYGLEVGALVVPFANPRHAHEHVVFRRHPLPDGLVLIAGVIDTTTNYVEHPDLVAERLVRLSEAIGDPTRIMATTDCGLESFVGYRLVAADVAWTKLRAMADGAAIASRQLFG